MERLIMNINLAKKTDDEPADMEKMYAVLKSHHGHTVTTGGPFTPATSVVDSDRPKGDLAWQYLGKSVTCITCGSSLSGAWYA